MVHQSDKAASSQTPLMPPPARSRSGVSFTIAAKTSTAASFSRNLTRPLELPAPVVAESDRAVDPAALPVMPTAGDLPALPRVKRTAFSSHRHEANPALAMTLLQEIGSNVEQWQSELRRVLLAIQAIYMEGPIVDGWLESDVRNLAKVPDIKSSESAVWRYGDIEQLQSYIQTQMEAAATATPAVQTAPQTQYHLCSLNAEGRLQCQPCPPEQLSTVSLAIARHQKIRQLLNQKQYLEARLKRAVEVLTSARSELGLSPTDDS
ncbi:hypothetical protein [Sphaerothrix gracilis]|uniref:hypothetical protein n=1 Tax=Sphaerothrix gracilis TaxID=3151835 RepID=UPI0031FE0BCF